ncbi:MAG: PAS domain-containing sensor histidine kinase, partial [Gammaproteobacteria bacterium]|nr:PAS domain-containing sensor histidine kinase [Gammaproteobacteria bacterium]
IVAERTRELESSELYQRSIVENIVDGLVTIDDKGIVTSFNPAAVKIFGYQPDEVIGNNIKMLMPDPYQSEHDGYLGDYHKTNEKKIIGIGREVEGQCKDGSTFPMDLAVNEVNIGDTHFFIGIVRNITERKQSERAMVEAKELAEKNNQMKSEFLNIMSHELRTPLTVIIGYLPLLKNEATMPEPAMVADIAQDMDSAGKHLLALINDVLDLSKIEAGKMSLRCEEIPLRPFTEDFLNNLRVSTNEKGVSLICEADEGVLYADPVRLKQILINLVGNAIKFTHHGSVTVSVRKVDGGAEFKVIDTGSGMPEEDLPFIFDKFHQIDSSSTRNIGGTGLGLSITKKLIELHGGEVTVMSKPGEGAVFTFTILNQEMNQNG